MIKVLFANTVFCSLEHLSVIFMKNYAVTSTLLILFDGVYSGVMYFLTSTGKIIQNEKIKTATHG